MKGDPRVSVIIPSYDCGHYLPKAITSVLAQTYADFELLIVDDGSTDDTTDVVARYLADSRVRYVRHPANRGPSAARNTGIRETTGALVAFLDADDYWVRDKLEAEVAALSDPAIGVCYVASWLLMPDGRQILARKRAPLSGDGLYRELLFKNSIPGSSSSIMTRRECFDRVGLFDEALRGCEDRDMWVRLAASDRFAFIDRSLVFINRRRDDSAIKDDIRMARGREAFLRNRERDMPARYRHLLPELRRRTYLTIAKKHYRAGDYTSCRRYCTRSISSIARIDPNVWKAAKLLTQSLLPVRLR